MGIFYQIANYLPRNMYELTCTNQKATETPEFSQPTSLILPFLYAFDNQVIDHFTTDIHRLVNVYAALFPDALRISTCMN